MLSGINMAKNITLTNSRWVISNLNLMFQDHIILISINDTVKQFSCDVIFFSAFKHKYIY